MIFYTTPAGLFDTPIDVDTNVVCILQKLV